MPTTKHIPSLHDVLAELFRALKIEGRMEYGAVYKIWSEAVGEQIARNAYPAAFRGGTLFVNVASSPWMQELSFLKGKILEKLNSRLGNARLKDIRFKIGPLPQDTSAASREPLPSLSAEELKNIREETAPIADPELRETFQRVIAAHLQNRKKG